MTNGRSRPDRRSYGTRRRAVFDRNEAIDYLRDSSKISEVFKINFLNAHPNPVRALFKEGVVIMDGERGRTEHHPYIALASDNPDRYNQNSRSLKNYVTFCLSIQHAGDIYSVDTVHRRYSKVMQDMPEIILPREEIQIGSELGLVLGKFVMSSAIIEGHPLSGIVRGHKKNSAH